MRQQLRLIFRGIALPLCLGWGGVGAYAQQFMQPVVIQTGSWPSAIFNADVNGDGMQDLVYMDYGATQAASTTHVLLNDGHGKFTPVGGAIATAGTSLVVASLVAGGPVDLGWVAVSGSTGSIYLAQGNGDGTFKAATLLASFSLSGANVPVLRLASANLSSSNAYPALLIEDTANAELYEAVSQAGQATVVHAGIPLIAGATEMIAQDINGDGITDVLIQGSHGVEVFLGQPAYGFEAPVTYPCTGTTNSMLLYDVDNDGIADLTVEGANGGYDVYHGAANGTFAAVSEGGTQAHDPATGCGGFLIGVTTVGPANATRRHFYTATPVGLSVLLGQGNVTYVLKGIYNMGPGRTSYAFADFNGDGYPDVAVDSPQGIAILYGNADSSMQSSLAFAAGQPAYSVTLGQFAGSGNLDAVVATGIPQVQLMNGDGAGDFAVDVAAAPAGAAETDAGRDTWSSVAEGDFDGDGKPDAAITLEGGASASGTTEGLSILFGNGTFATVSEPGPGFGVSAVGDFNGDGSSDILNFDGSYGATYAGGIASRSGTMPRDILFTSAGGSGGPSFNLVATGFLKSGRTNKQDVVIEDGVNFMVYQNNGDGTFTKVNTITPMPTIAAPVNGVLPTSGYFPGSMVLADLDGDGFGDLIIAFDDLASDPKNPSTSASHIFIYWGEGNGQFAYSTDILSPRNFYQVGVVSFAANAQAQLVSSDGYLVNVQPFQGKVLAAGEKQYLAGQGINLVAAGDVNGDGRADLVVANGGLVLSNPVASGGVLASNPIVNSGGVTVLLNTQQSANATGTLGASPEPSIYADNFVLTATIAQAAGMPQATGSVTFSVDGTVVGTAALVNGAASFTVIPPPYSTGPPVVTGYIVGQHTITAVYAGDTNYNSLTLTGTHGVIGQPTTSTITQLDTTIYYGQEIGYDNGIDALLQAYPTNAGATSAPLEGGTLTTYIDGTIVCQAMAGTTFRCPDPPFEGFNAGQHSVVLAYSGNAYYAGSTSITYTVTILPDDTTTVVSSTPNPSTFGQSVTFTATTTAPFATPTPGTVTFYDGSTVIGTGTVNAQGVATFSTARLSVGTHNIGASFATSVNSSGTLNFNPSSLGVVSQTVLPPETSAVATVTILTSNINPSVVGQSILFTAAVETTGAFVIVPVGAVQFLDGGSMIGTGVLNSKGVATFTTSTLTAGLHTMTAVYAGNTDTAGSISSALMQQVNMGLTSAGTGFVMTVTPTVVSVGAGNTTSVSVMITELNNFNQPVQLSCSGLPNEASCTFAASLIPSSGGTTTLLIGASAPHNCGSNVPYFVAGGGRRGIGIFAAMVMLFFARRRRVLKGLVLAGMICVLPMLSGCGGNCTDLGTKPGSYTFTVMGTSTGSPVVTQTQVVKMTVTI